MGLSRDLPWSIFISTSLGQVNLDFSRLIVQGARIGTGFGDVRLSAPMEAFEPISVRSACGDIHFTTAPVDPDLCPFNPSLQCTGRRESLSINRAWSVSFTRCRLFRQTD